MSKDTGGPAFPVQDMGIHGAFGMTLRDYFAGQALAGCLAHNHTDIASSHVAEVAYRMADAMLNERAK